MLVQQDVYARLGVRRVINATCHWTRYGGTIIWPEALDAMRAAADAYVDLNELQDAASRIIAQHCRAEAGYVVSGCAAALMVGAAAIMTGDDSAAMAQLPDTTGLRNEWIARRMPRRKHAEAEYVLYGYAHAVRGAGGRFVEVGDTLDEIEAAIGPSTAGIYWVAAYPPNVPSPDDVIALARRRSIPILIDASNTLPPADCLYRFTEAGADLVAFSGGKGLRGPQGSGILAGRADLIAAARKQSAPTQGIGRVCKVSKEEIVGLVTALEIWAGQDHAAVARAHEQRTRWLCDRLQGLPDTEVEYVAVDHIGRPYPTVHLRLDSVAPEELLRRLLAAEPPVAVMAGPEERTVRIDVRELHERDVQRVADAVAIQLAPGLKPD